MKIAGIVLAAMVSVSLSVAAPDETETKVEKRVTTVVIDDGRDGSVPGHRIMPGEDLVDDEAGGPTAFLGVETMRVSATVRAHLGLPRGIGLVVQRVVPESAATGVLEKHDILTKFDDQLLVSADQLGVLVRGREPGESVTLTFVRGGEEQRTEIKLGERAAGPARVFEFRNERPVEMHGLRGPLPEPMSRAEAERLMSTLRQNHSEGSHSMSWNHNGAGPVARMMRVQQGNVIFSDDEGLVELQSNAQGRILTVKDATGKVLFSGPVDTDAQREALDDLVRTRLQKVENIETIEVNTDENFETEDVLVPAPGGGSANHEPITRELPADRLVSVQ